MKALIVTILLFAVTIVITFPAASDDNTSLDGKIISAVRVLGNTGIDESTILFNVKTKPASPLSLLQIRQDIKAIFKTGFFKEVSVDIQKDNDKVVVVFLVKEKPIVTKIELIGNKKLSTEQLKKELTIKLKRIYDPTTIKKDEDKIKAMYIEHGFNDVEVKSEVINTSSTNVTVIYKVIEGSKVQIAKVSFTGNKSFKTKKLRKILKDTRKHWMFSWLTDSGKFNEDDFQKDLDLLRNFYEDHGFARVEIGEPKVTKFDKQVSKRKIVKKIDILIPINEGNRYRIGNIEIKGNKIFNIPQIMRVITKIDIVEGTPTSLFKLPEPKFKQGESYSHKALQDAIKNLYQLYGTKGYIFVNIIPVPKYMDETKTIDFVINIHEGKQAFINSIEFKGNQRTRDKVLRRELRIYEGEVFNSSRLRYSLSRLDYLGYIENVKPEFKPTTEDPQKLDITIGLSDERRTELQVGGGYSNIDKVFLAVSFSEHNFLGFGQELNLSVTSSSRRREYSVRFVEDYMFDTRNAFSASVYQRTSSYYSDFDREARGSEIGVGRHFFEYVFGKISYQYEAIDIYNVEDSASQSIKDAEGTSLTSSFVFFLQRDRRNNRRDPSRGTRNYMVYEIANRFLGGDNIYYKATYDTSIYLPLLNKLIYAFHAKIQYASSYGGNTLPPFEYYILGGERTVRGFETSSIGPRDVDYEDHVIGGNKSLLFNHELIIPIADPLRLIFFYDQGDVYASDENYDLRTLRDAVGIELRVFVPMFWVPIRFIWGYNLKPYEFEPQSEFQFTIGSTF